MTALREAIALAIFRVDEEDPAAEFDTDEQWEKRISIFDSQPNPREDYLRYAEAVLAITEAEKAEAVRAALGEAAQELAQQATRMLLVHTSEGDPLHNVALGIRDSARRLAAEAGITVDTTTEEPK